VYFSFALVPALATLFIANQFKKINPVFIFIAMYAIGFLILINIPGFDFLSYISHKQQDFQRLSNFVQSNSAITIQPLENNIAGFLKNIPYALWNVLTRPYLWEAKSFLWIIPSIENILIILIIIAGVIGFKYSSEKSSVSFCCLFYALSVLILIGLTTPVIGSLLRYKAPLLPFLLMFFVYHFDIMKLKTRLWK